MSSLLLGLKDGILAQRVCACVGEVKMCNSQLHPITKAPLGQVVIEWEDGLSAALRCLRQANGLPLQGLDCDGGVLRVVSGEDASLLQEHEKTQLFQSVTMLSSENGVSVGKESSDDSASAREEAGDAATVASHSEHLGNALFHAPARLSINTSLQDAVSCCLLLKVVILYICQDILALSAVESKIQHVLAGTATVALAWTSRAMSAKQQCLDTAPLSQDVQELDSPLQCSTARRWMMENKSNGKQENAMQRLKQLRAHINVLADILDHVQKLRQQVLAANPLYMRAVASQQPGRILPHPFRAVLLPVLERHPAHRVDSEYRKYRRWQASERLRMMQQWERNELAQNARQGQACAPLDAKDDTDVLAFTSAAMQAIAPLRHVLHDRQAGVWMKDGVGTKRKRQDSGAMGEPAMLEADKRTKANTLKKKPPN